MPRGISSATVVPTASDDCGEDAVSRHSQPTGSDDEDGGRYSSEEEESNANVASVAQSGQDQFLQAAFHSKAPTVQSESIEYLKAAFDGQSTKATTLITEHGGERKSIPLQQPNTDQQKTVPPLIGKSLRQRSQSAVIQKQNGVELTKNYLELVRDFRQLRPFTRLPDGKYPADTLCVYCVRERPTAVFFPCQHMCVCNDCIEANNITTDYSSSPDWSACPICMTDIRLILPHSGKEEEKYWKWVLEIKPSLPTNFKNGFKEAGKRLNKNAGAAPTRGRRSSIVTMFRREGTFKEGKNPPVAAAAATAAATSAGTGDSPKPKVPPLDRRHSWQPGAESTVQNVAASSESDEAHNCSIL